MVGRGEERRGEGRRGEGRGDRRARARNGRSAFPSVREGKGREGKGRWGSGREELLSLRSLSLTLGSLIRSFFLSVADAPGTAHSRCSDNIPLIPLHQRSLGRMRASGQAGRQAMGWGVGVMV